MVEGDDLRHMTDIIEKQSIQLAKIIDDILETADIDSQTPNITQVRIDDIMKTALAQTQMKAKPGVELSYNTTDTDLVVATDSNMLERALMQVLDNAAKFTDKGHIDLSTSTDGDSLTIEVSDTGCGVPIDKQEWVFEQFTKVDEFIPGTGMGLTLCRAIMTRLGGKVYIDKTYTKGCKIIMVIPSK